MTRQRQAVDVVLVSLLSHIAAGLFKALHMMNLQYIVPFGAALECWVDLILWCSCADGQPLSYAR